MITKVSEVSFTPCTPLDSTSILLNSTLTIELEREKIIWNFSNNVTSTFLVQSFNTQDSSKDERRKCVSFICKDMSNNDVCIFDVLIGNQENRQWMIKYINDKHIIRCRITPIK